jgi:hypothetical protein
MTEQKDFMTQRAELQIGKLFRDLDGSVVHLKNIKNEICIWTAENHDSDGACGGATHIDNFRMRFAPVVAVNAAVAVPMMEPISISANDELAMMVGRLAGGRAQIAQYVSM